MSIIHKYNRYEAANHRSVTSTVRYGLVYIPTKNKEKHNEHAHEHMHNKWTNKNEHINNGNYM